jgi:periplasmic divalent cation tolerance protein
MSQTDTPSIPSPAATEAAGLILVYTTLPDMASAEALSRALVERRLAACTNIYPGMVALYEWKGAVERAEEVGVIIKTTAPRLDALLTQARALHPYETPALLVLGEVQGNPDYLAWARAQTGC